MATGEARAAGRRRGVLKRWSDDTARSIAAASLVFPVVSIVVYLLARIYERLRVGKIDPSLIVMSQQTDFYWRCAIAGWFGLSVAGFAYLAFRLRPKTRYRSLHLGPVLIVLLPLAVWAGWRFP